MKLDRIFTSGMVLPAGKNIRFYGEGRGRVEISLLGVTRSLLSENDKWCIEFPPFDYGGPYEVRAVLDGEEVVLTDVYLGDVYLFAGQSNMQFRLDQTNTPKEQWRGNDKIRIFCTDRVGAPDFKTPDDGWTVATDENAGLWSAIAYLVSSEVSRRKEIAVGAVACFKGATVIESWVPEGTFKKIGIDIPPEKCHLDHLHPEFAYANRDGMMYNNALSQVIPYALTGVVWYQGESDTFGEEAELYDKELEELIRVWRGDFKDEELPFVIVQIADCEVRLCDSWRSVQRAQELVAERTNNVKIVISRDISETDDIHPPTKDKLSLRIVEAIMDF